MKNKIIDAYISKSADFAKPILTHIRELVHQACPDVEETIKWGCPHFIYNKKMLCAMAAFKQHCALHFWKGSLIKGLEQPEEKAMGQMGRITDIKDLPSDKKLSNYIKQAMKIVELRIQPPAKPKTAQKKEVVVPDYFIKALSKNKKASDAFEKSSYSYKKEYVQWVTEAKTDATREKRMGTALEWIAEGKGRNWKYEKK